MMKLSRSQGFCLLGINCEELLAIRALVVALVQAHVDLVQVRVALVQGQVDLVQALFALLQAHPPQGGLIMGPGSGLVGSVCLVFERGVRRGQVCYSQFVSGVGWGEAEEWTEYIDTSPGAQQWGLMLGFLILFRNKTSSSFQLWYICGGE